MKIKLIAVLICAMSAPAFALDVSQAQEAVSHAERNYSTAEGSYRNAAVQLGSGVNGSHEEAALNQAATNRAQAYADLRSAQDTAANVAATVNQAPGTLTPTATYNPPSTKPVYSGVSQRPGYSVTPAQSINVAASTLHPDTPVNVTVNGVTQTTTAGAIAAVNPAEQIAVPHVAAFQRTAVKGGRNNESSHGSHVQGDNNGQNNQHDHAMGRASGVGGHSQFR